MGGSWERVQDVFPLFAGTNYAAGSTGGEATHTLTVDEMPSHNHIQRGADTYGGGLNYMRIGTGDSTGVPGYSAAYSPALGDTVITTVPAGGSQPHNNMPPYRTFYCWERVA